MPPRRFPPPWTVEDVGPEVRHRAFVVKDANGQQLATFCCRHYSSMASASRDKSS
jgi:hypothetical protein